MPTGGDAHGPSAPTKGIVLLEGATLPIQAVAAALVALVVAVVLPDVIVAAGKWTTGSGDAELLAV